MISGNGFEGNNEARAENSSFGQPMSICTEKSNVLSLIRRPKLIAIMHNKRLGHLFKKLAKLYKAFSVHLKHQTATRLPITEAMKEVGNLKRFLEGTVHYKNHLTLRKSPMAPKGKCKSDPKVRADDL